MKRKRTPPAVVENWSYFLRGLSRALDEIFRPWQRLDHDWEARASVTRVALYELSFAANLAQLARHLRLPMGRIRRDENVALRLLQALHEDDVSLVTNLSSRPVTEVTPDMGVAAIVMRNNQRAFIAFGFTVNELIAQARGGADSALFRAVRIDPCVLAGRTASSRIARAARLLDRKFFQQLADAIRHPGLLESAQQARLDAALLIMAMAGVLDLLTPATAYELLVKETRLYRSFGSADAKRSLWRKIQRFRETYATRVRQRLSPTST